MARRILVIADPEIADGFRLSGAQVAEAKGPAEAASLLTEAVSSGGFGLIVVDGDALAALPSTERERLDRLDHPLVVPVPMAASMRWRLSDRTDYIAGIVRAAIGYHVRLTD